MKEQKNWGDLKAFTPGEKSKELKPIVTISKTGSLKFNAAFFTAGKIKNPKIKSLKLSYSENNQAIVLTVKNTSTLNHFKFSGKTLSNVKAKRFFEQFKIDVKKHAGIYTLVLEKIPKKGKPWIIYLEHKSKK